MRILYKNFDIKNADNKNIIIFLKFLQIKYQ